MPVRPLQAAAEGIAIIGMGCRFPGAADVDAFWRLIAEGREGLREFSEEELRAAGVPPEVFRKPTYVPRGAEEGGMLDFEPGLFGLSPARAEQLSPQFRMFLRSVHEALEDAGYAGEPEGERVGVFAGGGVPVYLHPHPGLAGGERLSVGSGNAADFLASRVSFTFGFSGPANSIQTACSTALVAVNEACEALWAGRCEMAVAGGASYAWLPGRGYDCERGLMYSQEGRCRVFDARADGTIFSSGTGAVLLKPLGAALRDGDPIHAVIRGAAVNNDGDRRRGYASPSPDGQAQVIREAMARAGVTADDISLVEAHGTGTQKGDPVEVEGLVRAWRATSDRVADCPLGSVKSNIGHADAAAGIAGLIKVVLALKHRVVPPTLHVETPNPKLKLAESPFRLALQAEPWTLADESRKRIAAVSAFGLGGTNAHTIVEEAPVPRLSTSSANGWQLLPFSACTPEGLEGLLAKWPAFLRDNPEADLADAAFTLQRGRRAWKVRDFRVARSVSELAEGWGDEPVEEFSGRVRERRAVFLFPGQGAQYAGMARELWENDSVFREAFTDCARRLDAHLGLRLEEIVFPEDQDDSRVHDTEFTQPALFAIGWAQARRWRAWGIEPVAVGGHSIGEYVAATLAGVMSLDDALRLVARRGQLMARAGRESGAGGMTAVMAGEDRVEALLSTHEAIELAAVNGPAQIVLGGPLRALEALEAELDAAGLRFRRLKTSAAFHSRAMDSALAEFEAAFAETELSAPRLPVLSNLTGNWLTNDEAISPGYWAAHLRSTVRFADNLSTLFAGVGEKSEPLLLLEIGPGATLTSLARSCADADSEDHFIATLPGPKDDVPADRHSWQALGECWKSGYPVDWEKVLPSRDRRRLRLPGCHFVEQRLLAEGAFPTRMLTGEAREETSSAVVAPGSLFHLPVWREVLPPKALAPERSGAWLCFTGGFSRAFERRVTKLQRVDAGSRVKVVAGRRFARLSSRRYVIRPGIFDDYERLIDAVRADFGSVAGVLHFWSGRSSTRQAGHAGERFQEDLVRGAGSLAWLARILGEQEADDENPLPLNFITRGLRKGSGVPVIPANRALAATAGTVREEFPQLLTRVIELPDRWARSRDTDISHRLREQAHHPKLVFRDDSWWRPDFDSIDFPESEDSPVPFREKGVYVFTGGLGGLARSVALDLARRVVSPTLVLLNRTPLPPRDRWPAIAAGDGRDADRVRDVLAMENAGAEVIVRQLDVADPRALREVLGQVEVDHGRIRGVFHTAGVLRDAAIATRDPDSLVEVFAVKARPAAVLAEFFSASRERRAALDRIVLFSSISAELTPGGQVDYSAANAWLDGFAEAAHAEGLPVLSIGWPAWREVGMAAEREKGLPAASGLADELRNRSISPGAGTDALARLWDAADGFPRAVVAPFSMASRCREQREARQPRISEKACAPESAGNGSLADPLAEMVALWRAELKDPTLGPDDNYFDRGGDSVSAVRLLAVMRKRFGRTPPMSRLLSAPTPRNLVAALGFGDQAAETPATASSVEEPPPWVVPLARPETETSAPIFCFHAIDGGVVFYRDLAERLAVEGRAVYAVESPLFHDSGETIPETLEAAARRYLDAIRMVSPEGPRVFCGYSFGALVACEAGRIAREEGETVESVIMLDMFNPASVRIVGNVERLRRHWESSAPAPFAKRVGSLAWRVLRLAGWMFRHAAVHVGERYLWRDELRQKRALARRGYENLIRHHVPGKQESRTLLVVTETAWDKFEYPDDLRGWRGRLRGEVVLRHVGGTHLDVFKQPHLDVLVKCTREFLNREIDSTSPLPPANRSVKAEAVVRA